MSKIVNIGTTHSGKTCYFYGMLEQMLTGCKGFSLQIKNKKQYNELMFGIERLADDERPVEERWPQQTTEKETFDMVLRYNFKKLDDLEWVDYPGEFVKTQDEGFLDALEGADCLLICVDGALLANATEDNLDAIVRKFRNKCGLSLNAALWEAAEKNGDRLPPVCILFTKYDVVNQEMKNREILTKFLRKAFPVLMGEDENNRTNCMVTYCPVSLGKDIANGGMLDPRNVEKPICFANYLVQLNLLKQLSRDANAKISASSAKVAEYNKKGFFGKMFASKPKPLSEEQKEAIMAAANAQKNNLADLLAVIDQLPLFINGQEENWYK